MTLPAAAGDAEGYVRCSHCRKRLTIIVDLQGPSPAVYLAGRYWTTATTSREADDTRLHVWQHGRTRRWRDRAGLETGVGWLASLPAIIVCDNAACRHPSILTGRQLRVRSASPLHYSTCAELGCSMTVYRPAAFCHEHGGGQRKAIRRLPGVKHRLTGHDRERLAALRLTGSGPV